MVSSLYTFQISGKKLWFLWCFRLALAKQSPIFIYAFESIFFYLLTYSITLSGSVDAKCSENQVYNFVCKILALYNIL